MSVSTMVATPEPDPDEPGAALVQSGSLGGLPHLEQFLKLVDRIYRTSFVPAGLRNDAGATLACVMHGTEIGLRPMQSLNSIDMIEGRPALKPEAMRALILEAGHAFRVKSRTPERCDIDCRRREWPAGEWESYSYTMADARAAELASKKNWRQNPADMLFARATARMARAVFPDVIRGLSYIPEELESIQTTATVGTVEPDAAEQEPRETLRLGYNRMTREQQQALKTWWSGNLPKGNSWPAETFTALPDELVGVANAAIESLLNGEEPDPYDGGDQDTPTAAPVPDPPDDDNIEDAVIVEDGPADGEGSQTSGPAAAAAEPPNSQGETAERVKNSPSSDAERSPAPSPRPTIGGIRGGKAMHSGKDVLKAVCRELNIAPPERDRRASSFLGRKIKGIDAMTDEEAKAVADMIEDPTFGGTGRTEAQAVQAVADSFGDVTEVAG